MRISDWSSDVCSSDLYGPDSGTMSPDRGTATPMPDGSTSDPSMPQGSTTTPDATTPMPDGSTSSPTMQDGTMGNPTDTTGNVTPPPPTTPKDYPLCSKTVQYSCMNPSEAPKRSEEHTSELQSLMRTSYA